jgi:hypothetical protein
MGKIFFFSGKMAVTHQKLFTDISEHVYLPIFCHA